MTAPPTPAAPEPRLTSGHSPPSQNPQKTLYSGATWSRTVEIKGCPHAPTQPRTRGRSQPEWNPAHRERLDPPRPIHPPAAPHPHLLGSALPPRSHRPGAAPRPLRPAGVRLRGRLRVAALLRPIPQEKPPVLLSYLFLFQRFRERKGQGKGSRALAGSCSPNHSNETESARSPRGGKRTEQGEGNRVFLCCLKALVGFDGDRGLGSNIFKQVNSSEAGSALVGNEIFLVAVCTAETGGRSSATAP